MDEPAGAVYDSGDYAQYLRMAADADRLRGAARSGRGPRTDGRYSGVGLTSFIERTGYASAKFLAARGSRFGAHESVTLRANRSGGIDLYSGVPAFGQSLEDDLRAGVQRRRGDRARARSACTSVTRRRRRSTPGLRLAHDDRGGGRDRASGLGRA